jgi:hypothetical protein
MEGGGKCREGRWKWREAEALAEEVREDRVGTALARPV